MDDQRKVYPGLKRPIPQKGTTRKNYGSIKCLPVMWKILTALIKVKIFYMIISHVLCPNRMDATRKKTRTSDLLYIDQHILKERKTRRKKNERRCGLITKRYTILSLKAGL